MAHVQSFSENGYSATDTRSRLFTGVVAGNAILVLTRASAGSTNLVSGVSSSVDGAFTQLTDQNSGLYVLSTWYLENATPGSHTITYTTVGTGKTVRWAIAEYDDVPASGIIDVSADGTFTTTTTPVTSNVTTTGVNRTIISAIATDDAATTIVPAGGETERQEVNDRFQFQDEFAATAGSHGASWTLGATQPGVYAILALKPGAIKYLKLLAHSSAASDTGITGHVFSADESSYIGKFTGAAFEASLEGTDAVLKVAVTEFGGSALTTSDTPKAFIYSSTDASIGPASCTVIEE